MTETGVLYFLLHAYVTCSRTELCLKGMKEHYSFFNFWVTSITVHPSFYLYSCEKDFLKHLRLIWLINVLPLHL